MAFDCYFLGGVSKFVMDGHKITGLDTQGKKVFSHTYRKLDKENENGFIFYQSEDENSGEFTYFAFSLDTMATTCPYILMSGPPELPSLMAALVCRSVMLCPL